jgi:hypothetical protein
MGNSTEKEAASSRISSETVMHGFEMPETPMLKPPLGKIATATRKAIIASDAPAKR